MNIENLKKAKDKVKYLLCVFPETRDCDKKLYITYMTMFHNLHNEVNFGTYETFCDMFFDVKTPAPESIRRARQKVQEMNPDLRGEKYHKRQAHAFEVRDYLKEF